jgi:hypothetical protein
MEVEVEPEVKKQGRPWTVSRKFTSFEEADNERMRILTEGTHQAKVRRRENEKFVVKSRKLKNEKQQSN